MGCRRPGKVECNAITMHTIFRVLLLWLASSCFAYTLTVESQASYLESGAPVVILHNASLPVYIRCRGEVGDEVAVGLRSPRSTLKPAEHWSINFALSSEDPLYCTFRSQLRKWNCDERWLIKDACLWEKPRTAIMPGHVAQTTSCPRCDTRNSIGKPVCVWIVKDDGVYVRQWDPERKEEKFTLKYPWHGDDPAFYKASSVSKFSVANDFPNTVQIQCDVVSEVIFLEAASRPGGENPKWEYEIDPIMDLDYPYYAWTCDFEVLDTKLQRPGVQIWSPLPEVNTWVRKPDCIDCAWKLNASGLWVDDRSCYMDKPLWVKEHGWDSVANTSTTDDMDWSPYYYPLKRFSHAHHI